MGAVKANISALNPNTTKGKTVRTFLQVVVGMLLIVLTDRGFRDWVTHSQPGLAAAIPVVCALMTYVHNYLDPTVPNS